MTYVNKLLAVGAFIAAAAVATQSQATTYLLTTSPDLGNANYGTVKVTDTTLGGVASLKYVVTLNQPYSFVDNGNGHVDFAFSLTTDPTLGLSTANPLKTPYITLPGSSGWSLDQSPNGVKNSPFDGFDYGLECTKAVCGPNIGGYTGGAAPGHPATLTFYVTAPGITDSWVDATPGDKAYFAVDVRNNNTKATGAVAAFAEAVPEPATWAVMGLGVFSIGLALRLRRQGAAQPASA
jgi:hypothetical protein